MSEFYKKVKEKLLAGSYPPEEMRVDLIATLQVVENLSILLDKEAEDPKELEKITVKGYALLQRVYHKEVRSHKKTKDTLDIAVKERDKLILWIKTNREDPDEDKGSH